MSADQLERIIDMAVRIGIGVGCVKLDGARLVIIPGTLTPAQEHVFVAASSEILAKPL